jgi:hypothetical protein
MESILHEFVEEDEKELKEEVNESEANFLAGTSTMALSLETAAA